MEYTFNEIREFVTIAKPFTDPIISTFIKPKIEQLAKWLKSRNLENKVIDNYFENKFEEYLARTHHNCKNINILIFQNQQIKIEDIYYPLTIKCTKDNQSFRMEKLDLETLEPYKKILVSDTAGMGKSTIMKWVCLKIIEDKLGIPVLIELRNIKENNSILDEIFNQINPVEKSFDKDLIVKFLELGNFIILFDGFDEIQLKNQEAIIKDLREFINKTSNNLFILTSRPEGALAAFGDFQLFNILPLKKEESFELIKKYDSICPIKIGNKLIEDIETNFKQTQELLRNPFLVSLIYSTYTYNQDIPSNKATFYEEIYSALFKRHDLSKDGWTRPKKSKLDIQQFKTVVRQLAFDTAVLVEVTYSEPELLKNIEIAKSKCPGFNFNIVDFFDDLISAVPLFQRDGSKIRWAHKSLQDFFAADFIAFDSRKEDILTRIYTSNRDSFFNILQLFYEIDFKTFRNVIIRNLLVEYQKFYNETYRNIESVEKQIVDERKSLTFEKQFVIIDLADESLSTKGIDSIQNLDFFKHRSVRSIMLIENKRILAVSFTFKRQLWDLIIDKNESLILPIDYKKVKINFGKEKKIEINDKPSVANLPENFGDFNKLLASNYRSKEDQISFMVNIDSVKSELELIEREIKKENSVDTFKDI